MSNFAPGVPEDRVRAAFDRDGRNNISSGMRIHRDMAENYEKLSRHAADKQATPLAAKDWP